MEVNSVQSVNKLMEELLKKFAENMNKTTGPDNGGNHDQLTFCGALTCAIVNQGEV